MICPKCGRDAANHMFCPECGEELIANEDCAKVSVEETAAVPSSDPEPNPLSTNQKTKKWKLFAFLAPAVAIVVALIAVLLSAGKFDGTYKFVGDSTGGFFVFKNGSYSYSVSESSDPSNVGTYELDGDMLNLFDSNGNENAKYYKDGKYIFSSDTYFDQKIGSGSKVDQRLSASTETEVNGILYNVSFSIDLRPDGTYYYFHMISSGWMNILSSDEETGKYTRSGNILHLRSDDDDNEHIYMIRDDIVYITVYKKG